MIKICHIVDRLNIGGLEKTLIDIALNLNKYEHQVWCLKDKGVLAKEIEAKAIRIREFNFEGGLRFPLIFKLAKELKSENFSIIHSHGLFPSIWARLAAILAKVPVRIVHCQNLFLGIPIRTRIELRLLSMVTTKIIAVSEAVKRNLIEFVGISPKKIIVIYNSAPEMRPASPDRVNRMRKNLGLNSDTFLIGSIGRLEDHKGHAILIDAVAKCKMQYANCKCIIVGDGPERENLKSRIKAANLEESVILLGWRKDIEDLLQTLDLFVQPSTLKEGLPLVLAEAASAGLALIATAIGGNSEVVEDGVNGFIVASGDSQALAERIKYFMESREIKERMGENSKKIWKKKFSSQEMMNKVDSLYRNLIQEKIIGKYESSEKV